MLRALLAHGHDVTLLTHTPFDAAAIDRHLGTDLCSVAARLSTETTLPLAERMIGMGRRLSVSLDLLRSALLIRECRRRERDYDLVVSAHNEWPMRGPAVSYVHYPSRARPRPAADLRWFHQRTLLAAYTAFADRLADFTSADVQRQHLLVNSAWTNEVLHRTHGVWARVVPPVVELAPFGGAGPAWSHRSATFVCAGRFAPEKRHDDVIAIVRGVRARGHDVRLLFVGNGSARAAADLRTRAAQEGFVDVQSGLDRRGYIDCLRNARFGIHAMRDEHFGIAPAEMIEAGCVTWGHRSGGVADVLGPTLTWTDIDDAVARIDRALREPAVMQQLRAEVDARRGRFRRDHFDAAFIAAVDTALRAELPPTIV